MSMESPIPPSEIASAEENLGIMHPEQRVMTQVQNSILAPLEAVGYPDDKKEIIREYANKAAEAARAEFIRLQEESPARRIIDALNNELAKQRGGFHMTEQALTDSIGTVTRQVGFWQKRTGDALGMATLQRKKPTLEEIVRGQIEEHKKNHKNGLVPRIGNLMTEYLTGAGEVEDRMETAVVAEGLLKGLGFLPQEASVRALFTLPKPETPLTEEAMGTAIWSGQPTRVHWDKVTGLQSSSMPGVAATVFEFGGDRAMVWFDFKPEAVAKSVVVIPSAATASIAR